MRKERRAILALMAAGRISAPEAERLLRAWNDGQEQIWIATACLLICIAQFHLQLSPNGHFLGALVHHALNTLRAAGWLLSKGMGGTV
jgi:hypothetical protein